MACVIGMTVPSAGAQMVGPPAPAPPKSKADEAAAKAREMVDPIKRCKPADDGSINVCASDTELHRLSPELREIAGIGKSTKDGLPRAAAQGVVGDKLPYNWMSLGGRYKPGPEYNEQFEAMKRATDPETGTPAAPEEEP